VYARCKKNKISYFFVTNTSQLVPFRWMDHIYNNYSHTLTLNLTHTLSLNLTHTHTLSQSHTHTHASTHALTQELRQLDTSPLPVVLQMRIDFLFWNVFTGKSRCWKGGADELHVQHELRTHRWKFFFIITDGSCCLGLVAGEGRKHRCRCCKHNQLTKGFENVNLQKSAI